MSMKEYSRIEADSMCESHILSAVRGFYYEYRIAATERAKQAGSVGGADFGVQKQWTERKDLVQRKWCLRTELLQMAEEIIYNG